MFKSAHTYRTILKRAAVSVFSAAMIFSFCSCSSGSTDSTTINESLREEMIASKSNSLIVHKFIVEILGFNIEDEFIDGAEAVEELSADFPRIKIVIKKEKADEMLSILNSKLGTGEIIGPSQIRTEEGNQFASEVRQMRGITKWVIHKTGKSGKEVDLNVYMAKFAGNTFIYIM